MENKDLKWIKKHYSETLMKICRDNFSTLLEKEGLLKEILSTHFAFNKYLGQDIIKEDKIDEFKEFIYSQIEDESNEWETTKTATELLDEAGYILYPECKSEEDIQSFRHYYKREGATPIYQGGTPDYQHGEELCTFNGGRLKSCRVWFAIKKNVDEIKRENFINPKRQDEYGTSVLSIQVSKGKNSFLSIKNRYNDKVNNPDATFSNNLDNIIPGLTKAFCNDYNITLRNNFRNNFELNNYVRDIENRYHRYNLEINNIYYCHNNIIIDNNAAKRLQDRYILMDYFVVDLANNTIRKYDNNIKDSFVESLGKIEKINLEKIQGNRVLRIKVKKGEDVLITLNDRGQIIKLYNANLLECGDNFLFYNNSLTDIELPSLKKCKSGFLFNNHVLANLNLTMLEECENNFLSNNFELTNLTMPLLRKCGDFFLYKNNNLIEFQAPVLEVCGDGFLNNNTSLRNVNLKSLKVCGNWFLLMNNSIDNIDLSSLIYCGNSFLRSNNKLKTLDLSKLRECGRDFLAKNNSLIDINLSKLEKCGDNFLFYNTLLSNINLPSLKNYGKNFLYKLDVRNDVLSNVKSSIKQPLKKQSMISKLFHKYKK